MGYAMDTVSTIVTGTVTFATHCTAHCVASDNYVTPVKNNSLLQNKNVRY